MRTIQNIFLRTALCIVCVFASTACSEDEEGTGGGGLDNTGITESATELEQTVSVYGETNTLSFTAAAAWTAALAETVDWAKISGTTGNTAAGKGSVRVTVEKNTTGKERTVSVNIKVEGYTNIATYKITQSATASGADVSTTDMELNEKMHNYLKEHYLFKDEYNTLTVATDKYPYGEFLNQYLLGMKTNAEDGGIYREYSSYAGERYIYSYIEKASSATRANTRATTVTGLGLGTFFSSFLDNAYTKIGLAIGYVYDDSPAAKADLRRGDVITGVNGVTLNKSNYNPYMQELFYTTSGTYVIDYVRYEPNEELQKYELIPHTATVTAAGYTNSPVLTSYVISEKDKPEGYKIGYLVYQAFDLNFTRELEFTLNELKKAEITDLILDLRYNYGGSVPVSCYLSSAIAGTANNGKVFTSLERSTTTQREEIKFGADYELGVSPVDLGLSSVIVIMSEETASSSELLISSLKGIDFDIYTVGSKSEGKNVGMEVQTLTAGSSTYEFAPITFRTYNAKNWCDYADGMMPDLVMNNQNTSYKDDIDDLFPYAFGDWTNMDFNLPLWYSFCRIAGLDPETGKEIVATAINLKAPATRAASTIERTGYRPDINIVPLKSAPLKRPLGTFGSLIYNQAETEK